MTARFIVSWPAIEICWFNPKPAKPAKEAILVCRGEHACLLAHLPVPLAVIYMPFAASSISAALDSRFLRKCVCFVMFSTWKWDWVFTKENWLRCHSDKFIISWIHWYQIQRDKQLEQENRALLKSITLIFSIKMITNQK